MNLKNKAVALSSLLGSLILASAFYSPAEVLPTTPGVHRFHVGFDILDMEVYEALPDEGAVVDGVHTGKNTMRGHWLAFTDSLRQKLGDSLPDQSLSLDEFNTELNSRLGGGLSIDDSNPRVRYYEDPVTHQIICVYGSVLLESGEPKQLVLPTSAGDLRVQYRVGHGRTHRRAGESAK